VTLPGRGKLATLGVLYGLAILYSSLVLGPFGFHYVPITLSAAWQKFLEIRFIGEPVDQRPDTIANMLILIPLGFLAQAALGQGGRRILRALGAVSAFVVCVLYILAVKFAQLYFPPRTVTLNYVTAQTVGVVLGIGLFWIFQARIYPVLNRKIAAGEGLAALLLLYTAWLVVYFLLPLDFTANVTELGERLRALPAMLVAPMPGAGRPLGVRLLTTLADIVATVPVGMLLSVVGRRRSLQWKLSGGLGLVVVVELASLFVIDASPLAAAIVYRMAGIIAGVAIMEWIKGRDLRRRRYYLSKYVPIALPIYAVFVLLINGLFTSQWLTLDQAMDLLEARQFLPFWNHYIVSKSQASASLVATAALFAPIGVMIWARRSDWLGGAAFAGILAAGLSLMVELGRWLKPGMRPDFTDPFIAAAAAAIAFRGMPTLWQMFEREATLSSPIDAHVAALRDNGALDPLGAPMAPNA